MIEARSMRTRPLGKTGLSVSELSLGTWGLSGDGYGPVSTDEARDVIVRARAMGIDTFETASNYARGGMERVLGDALAGDTNALVITKLGTDLDARPPQKRFDYEYLGRALAESRERLGELRTVALLHNPSVAALRSGAAELLRSATERGEIQSWGVSAGSLEVAEAALELGAPILSFSYNVLQVQPLRALEKRVTETGTGVLAHSVLAYGLLAGRWPPSKQFRYGDHRAARWPEGTLGQRIRLLDAVRPLVSGDVVTMRSAAVRFVLSNEAIASVILGPHTGPQLDQLVREASTEPPYLSAAKLDALEKRLQNLDVPR